MLLSQALVVTGSDATYPVIEIIYKEKNNIENYYYYFVNMLL